MALIILPGMANLPPGIRIPGDDRDCALCDQHVLYLAMFTIRAYDIQSGLERTSMMEFPVCDAHADKVSFEIKKELKAPADIILV